VEVRGLSKAFGARAAVREVSLVLEPGTTTTLVGPSGSGKTTLLRCLAGLLEQDAGDILFDGRPVSKLPAERRGVGFVFQSYALFPHLSVADNIGFGLDVRGVPRPERGARVQEVAVSLGLSELLERRPAEISGGERQRVALGRAIAYRPVLLLLDEPLAALDPNLAAAVREVLVRAIARERTTVLFVTHDRADALRLGDRIALMRDGEIAESGAPQDVYRRPCSVWAANFFGEGVVWNLDGVAENGGASVVTPLGRVVLPGAPAGPLRLVVRPEAVRPAGAEGAAARVVSVAYEGDRYRLGVAFEGGQASLEWPADRPVRPGDLIRLGLEASLLVVLPGLV
jgi:ABC-type sugar transport system ATPase subunit